MNVVAVRRKERGLGRHGVGLAFVKCKIDVEWKHLMDYSVEKMESNIANYCLLLPWINDSKPSFDKEFAVVYDDWDVGDINHNKVLPGVCVEEMRDDILAQTI